MTITATLYETFGTAGGRRERTTHTSSGPCAANMLTLDSQAFTWYSDQVRTPYSYPVQSILNDYLVVSLQGKCIYGTVTRSIGLGCSAPILVSSLPIGTDYTMNFTG